MTNLNVNTDFSSAPGWVMALLLVATFAAEVLDHVPPSAAITLEECALVCNGSVANWSPEGCACHPGGEE